jgi:hypothetical protein
MANIIVTIILVALVFICFFKTEVLVSLFYGKCNEIKINKAKKEIRSTIGVVFLIAFIIFLIKVL